MRAKKYKGEGVVEIEMEASVAYHYEGHHIPGKYSGAWEDCYPDDDEMEVETSSRIDFLINGHDISVRISELPIELRDLIEKQVDLLAYEAAINDKENSDDDSH